MVRKPDCYGRALGEVWIEGQNVNFEMVREGMAWCYRKYLVHQECLEIEAKARESKAGLWQGESPAPPWEWRHRDKR